MGLRENFEDKIRDGKWVGSVNNIGYPKIKDDGKLRLASHVSLELAGRKGPKAGQVVMHRDNDIRNVAASNLRVGTQKENLKIMRDQGRDRPRGVAQEPDVKQAAWVGFCDELEKIAKEDSRGMRAGKAVATMAVGGGLGYAGGKALGYGLDLFTQNRTGTKIPANYMALAGAALGGALVAAEVRQNKKFKEALGVFTHQQNGAPRGVSGK